MPYTGFLLVKHSVDILRRALNNESTESDLELRKLALSEPTFREMSEIDRINHVKKVASCIMPGVSEEATASQRNMFNAYDLYSLIIRTAPSASSADFSRADSRSTRRFETYCWAAHEYGKRIVEFFDDSMAALVSANTVPAAWRDETTHVTQLTERLGAMHESIRFGGHYQGAMSYIARNGGFIDIYARSFGGWPDSCGHIVHMAIRLSHIINEWRDKKGNAPRAWNTNTLVRNPVVAYDHGSSASYVKDENDQGVCRFIGGAERSSGKYLVKGWRICENINDPSNLKIDIGGVIYIAEHTILNCASGDSRVLRYSPTTGVDSSIGRTYHGANGREPVRLVARQIGSAPGRLTGASEVMIAELGGRVVAAEASEDIHVCAACSTRYVGHRLHVVFDGEDSTLCPRCWGDPRALAVCERHEWSNRRVDEAEGPDEMEICCPSCMEENRAIRHLAYRNDDVTTITKSVGSYEIPGEPTGRFLSRLVGVEFETGLITDMMFKVKASKFFKTPGWQVHRDPSLESGNARGLGVDGREFDSHWLGWEFVTPPVGGAAIEPCVNEFYALRDEVITPKHMNIENVLAGMHVHADFRDFFDQLEKLCVGPNKNLAECGKLWKNFVLWGKESARIVRQFVSKRRREYCYCNGDLGYRGKHGLKSNLIQYALQNARIDNVNYPQYSALTLSGRTMEFRIWPSTDNIEYCLARVELTQKLTDFFMKNQETAGETLKTKAKTQTFVQRGLLVGRITEILGLSPQCAAALSALHRRYFFKTFERFDAWSEAKEQRQSIADAVNERDIGGVINVGRNDSSSETEYVQRDRGHNHVDLEIQNPELLRVAMAEAGVAAFGIDEEAQVTLLDTMVAMPSGVISRGDRTDRAMRYVKDDGSLERVACGYRVQS